MFFALKDRDAVSSSFDMPKTSLTKYSNVQAFQINLTLGVIYSIIEFEVSCLLNCRLCITFQIIPALFIP